MNTVVAPLLNTSVKGYPYVSLLDASMQAEIVGLQERLQAALPELLWVPEPGSLHVTFLHLISPDVNYPESPDAMYEQVGPAADKVMARVAGEFGPLKVETGEVVVSPAAVIIKWDDRGRMDEIREAFTNQFKVPALTKGPPNIVHTTIARFLKPTPVDQVREIARDLSVNALPTIAEIDLLRESRIYLQKFQVLERYRLRG